MHFNESWYQYVRELQDTSSAFFIRAFCTSSLCIRKKKRVLLVMLAVQLQQVDPSVFCELC